jgi:MinD-like ATPase involved in chromosome partitioning or flagellar assembly
MADLKKEQVESLVEKIKIISADREFLLVDTASGISNGVVSFLLASPEVIVGVSPEPTSLTDAYALIKVLKKNEYQGRISMFSSMVSSSSNGLILHKKISSAAQRFLDTHVEYLGSVYQDEKLKKAVGDQVPAVGRYPTSDISRCYRVIALTLLGQEAGEIDQEKFWTRLISMITKMSRPKVMKAVSFNGDGRTESIETTIHSILDEQRRTRELLEKIFERIEKETLSTKTKSGPSA